MTDGLIHPQWQGINNASSKTHVLKGAEALTVKERLEELILTKT